MECCEPYKPHYHNFEKDLKRSLYLLHMFQIVHLDVKSANICFSPSFGKYVFIDFGLSIVTK